MRYDKYDGICQRCEESGDCILVDDLWTCSSCVTLQFSRLRGQLAEARVVIEVMRETARNFDCTNPEKSKHELCRALLPEPDTEGGDSDAD